jgi:hypothetical protein
LRKRNIRKIISKINQYKNEQFDREKVLKSFQGWQAYAKWANTYKLRKYILKQLKN